MKLHRSQITKMLITAVLFTLLVNHTRAQAQTTLSWSNTIDKGDIFQWRVDSFDQHSWSQNMTDLSFYQINTTDPYYNSTDPYSNQTISSTTSQDVVTSTVTVVTSVETSVSTSGPSGNIAVGSILEIQVIKDLDSLSIGAPLLDNEGYYNSSMNEYFNTKVNGEESELIFPIYIMIVPVQLSNGLADNFFEQELISGINGEFKEGEKAINDGVFYYTSNIDDQNEDSSFKTEGEVSWDVASGVLNHLKVIQEYNSATYGSYYGLTLNLHSTSNGEQLGVLDLPLSNFFLLGLILIPILRKIKK